MDIKKGKADMRTLKKTGIVLGMTVTMMTCVACGKERQVQKFQTVHYLLLVRLYRQRSCA